MQRYCKICNGYVQSEGHTHPEKQCEACKQVKKLDEFPVHSSSLDGHKHTCTVCYVAQRERNKAERAAAKIRMRQEQAERQAKREQENVLLQAYGYYWQKKRIEIADSELGVWEEEQWMLFTSGGNRITLQDALQEIAHLQVHTPGHPSTIWAKEILMRPNVVVLDTETTGIGANAEIIDIAIIDLTGHIRLNTLMQCQSPTIPPKAKALHHINEQMLKGAPTFLRLWDRLMRFLSTREIIIFNAEFDMRMLRQTAQRYQLPMPDLRAHCLMKQYAEYVGQKSLKQGGYRLFKLSAACFHFGIKQPKAHRALPDTQSTLALLQKMATMADAAPEAISQPQFSTKELSVQGPVQQNTQASLADLSSYLEQGLTLRGGCLEQETLAPEIQNGELVIRWDAYLMEGEWATPQYYTLDRLQASEKSRESWGVVFASVLHESISEYHIKDVEEIERLLKRKTPHFLFGKLQK